MRGPCGFAGSSARDTEPHQPPRLGGQRWSVSCPSLSSCLGAALAFAAEPANTSAATSKGSNRRTLTRVAYASPALALVSRVPGDLARVAAARATWYTAV